MHHNAIVHIYIYWDRLAFYCHLTLGKWSHSSDALYEYIEGVITGKDQVVFVKHAIVQGNDVKSSIEIIIRPETRVLRKQCPRSPVLIPL